MEESNTVAGKSDAEETKEGIPKPQHHEKKPGKPLFSSLRESLFNVYDTQYKKLLIIPAAVVVLAVLLLLFSFASTGELFKRDISLSGGVSVSALTNFDDTLSLESELAELFPGNDLSVRKLTQLGNSVGLVVEANIKDDADADRLISVLSERLGVKTDDLSVQRVGASLGQSFFRQALKGMVLAFVFMAFAVLVFFRISAGRWIWMPSVFVVWTVLVDILCVLAVISITGISLSAAGLAAFLMLIGYSVDTDILLTTRALKGSGDTIAARIRSAARTGILMTIAGFVAVSVGYLFAEADTIRQIMLILSVGLVFDLLHTWLTNTGLLRWYLEKRGMA